MKRITGRNWAFVVYPESLPKDYEDIIINSGLPMCFSPLHDKDLNPDGTPKKPHYHVICYYENPTTFKNVKENVCDRLHGTIPIKLESMSGMYRYHLHLDNPEKYQYDDRFRTFYNGFDVGNVTKLTYTEVSKLMRELQQIIRDKHILEYSDLLDLLLDCDLFNLWDVAINHTIMLDRYISSRRYKTLKESSTSGNELPIIDIMLPFVMIFLYSI